MMQRNNPQFKLLRKLKFNPSTFNEYEPIQVI